MLSVWRGFGKSQCCHMKDMLIMKQQSFRSYSSGWKRRTLKRDQLKEVVYEYATPNSKKADRVYVWGYAATGALGVKRFLKPGKSQRPWRDVLAPYRLRFLDENNIKAVKAACGYGFTVLLCRTEDGPRVYGCGINTDSQLSFQEYPRKSGRILDFVVEPAPIDLPLLNKDNIKLIDVACGRAHTVILTNEGLLSLGNNAYGQCGREIIEDEIYKGSQLIHPISLDKTLKQIVCGQDHTLFLTETGEVFSCGLGSDGQTGVGHYDTVTTPTKVIGDIQDENIVHISSKADCVLAVSDNGHVFGWGNSEYGQLASVCPDETQVNIARHLPFHHIGRIVKTAAAGSMCALLNDQGQVFVWGYGILGKGPKLEQSSVPQLIPDPLFGCNEFNPDQKVVDIQCGITHFAAQTSGGDVYMWGVNKSACLGMGNVHDQFFPFKVQVAAEVNQIACGIDHTIVIGKSFA